MYQAPMHAQVVVANEIVAETRVEVTQQVVARFSEADRYRYALAMLDQLRAQCAERLERLEDQ